MKHRINMSKALKLKYTPKYKMYSGKDYPAGEGLSLIVDDMCSNIAKELHSGCRFVTTGDILFEITGNKWEVSDHPDFDHMIKINGTYAWYTNSGYNAVKKYKK